MEPTHTIKWDDIFWDLLEAYNLLWCWAPFQVVLGSIDFLQSLSFNDKPFTRTFTPFHTAFLLQAPLEVSLKFESFG